MKYGIIGAICFGLLGSVFAMCGSGKLPWISMPLGFFVGAVFGWHFVMRP